MPKARNLKTTGPNTRPKKRKTKVELRSEKLNSPEAVAERMGGLVRDPEFREPVVTKPVLDEKGVEIGRGDICPFCTHATNAHHPNCKLVGGNMKVSASLQDTFESGQLNRTEAKNG
jgi:hypothetical protein